LINSKDRIFNFRFNWRSFINQYPRFYSVWQGFRSPLKVLGLSKYSTDLVLEGYPRSGNTFAWYAFIMSQSYPVNVAHHLHNPARVIEAVKNKIPTLILIREPKECVLSFCIYEPRLSIRMGLVHWIRFYSSISKFNYGYVLASFDEVISDFGQVMKKVNFQFGTQFDLFDHTNENINNIYLQMEMRANYKASSFNNSHLKDNIWKPSEKRNQKKKDLEIYLNKEKKLLSLLSDAQDLYYSISENLFSDPFSGRNRL